MRRLITLAAVVVAAASARAEVRVIAGSPAGRAVQAPDPAVINEPFAVAFDAAGRLYGVEHTRGDRLFRITDPAAATPQVEFSAGVFRSSADKTTDPVPPVGAATPDVPGLDARFNGLHDVTIAADGTLYIALREGNALVEVKEGVVRTVVNAAGRKGYGGDGGAARDALLSGPKYVALDGAGRVLVADTENHCIRRYDPAARTIETIAGTPPQAGATLGRDLRSTQLKRPHGCRLDPTGRLVIADSDNDRIIVGDLPGGDPPR